MKPVTVQIADAIVEVVKTVPSFEGRVFPRGAIDWDRRTFPIAIVTTAQTTFSTQLSGNRRSQRPQTRATTFMLEVQDLETEGLDYVEKLAGIMRDIESCLGDVGEMLPIDDLLVVNDTGMTLLQDDRVLDREGVHCGQALTISVTFSTVEGRADSFVPPTF